MAQPEEVRAVMRELKRQWREKNPDKDKEYARKARERKLATQKQQEERSE